MITYDTALATLREVVDEFGADFVYEAPDKVACVYEVGGAPSCLIGQVLHRLGLPLPGTTDDMSEPFLKVATNEVYACETAALTLLCTAQSLQDTGSSWGYSVTAAEARVKEAREQGLLDETREIVAQLEADLASVTPLVLAEG